MQITHLRIDDRLIHGQVATLWANSLGINRIMVIDDIVATNEIQKLALKLAVPKGISLSVFSIKLAAERLVNDLYKGQRLLVIMRNPESLLNLIEIGVKPDKVTIGVLSNRPGTKQLNHDIYILPEEKKQIRKINQLGIQTVYQAGPNSVPTTFSDLMGE